ncbi:MAG: hypothetical protein RI964_1622 [Pseudomonadota bacterium]|jgi:hypothetical protein
MTTVFLSGSITITRLNNVILARLQNIIDKQFAIVVGDANGADKALQKHLSTLQYPHVTVFCAGNICRNNLGNWPVKHISVDATITGRAFYTQKDKAMASAAVAEIDKKIRLTATLQTLDGMAQNTLSFAAPSLDERKQRYYQATRNEWVEANIAGYAGDLQPLQPLFGRIVCVNCSM